MTCRFFPIFASLALFSQAAETSLSRDQAESTGRELAAKMLESLKSERAAEMEAKSITHGDKTLRWLEKEFGKAPDGKRSLWISMHGGGGAPKEVNDQQWQNQITLYQPKEGIYVAPRAPNDAWNMWHQPHIDPLFDRLIQDMVATRGVDPDRVYLMGYSAGGDGVWQLAPRMADRFAAASMMAGHPGDASLLGLRNLPFAVFVGGEDAAYDRNKLGASKGVELDSLQTADPKGYTHLVKIYPGMPHWMGLKDAEAVPWMSKFTRNPWPDKIVWVQDDVLHDRFYWLELPAGFAKAGQKMTATVKDREILLGGDVPPGIVLYLSDSLLTLDSPLTVKVNGAKAFQGTVPRTRDAIGAGLKARQDPGFLPCAVIRIDKLPE
ncbi:MAG: alpha/beta hydrolase [Luteolibacter sp.]